MLECCPSAELHDAKHQPDIKNGSQIGMPLAEFTDRAWEGLVAGKDSIPVGMSERAWENVELPRIQAFEGMRKAMAAQKN